jgi:hypothetical protein
MINGIRPGYPGYAASQNQRTGSSTGKQFALQPLAANDSPAPAPSRTAGPAPGQPMPVRTIDVVGWGFPQLPPANADDLEFNAYRPDGVVVNGASTPFSLAATGQALTGNVAAQIKQQVDQVALGRVRIYNEQKASGKTNAEIKQALQDYDAALPDSYKQLVGWGSKFDQAARYDLHRPTRIDDTANALG